MEIARTCRADNCIRSAERSSNGKNGYCSMHYQRAKRRGDPNFIWTAPTPALDWIRENSSYSGDDCLVWPFHIAADGYGRAHMPETGKLTTASRLMCIVAHGEPPAERYEAAHSCGKGNGGCTNPRHLYWALPTENQGDRIKHGTSNRGSRQGKSKLTESDVIKIRTFLGAISQAEIARRFNVAQCVISDIKTGRRWAWLNQSE